MSFFYLPVKVKIQLRKQIIRKQEALDHRREDGRGGFLVVFLINTVTKTTRAVETFPIHAKYSFTTMFF